MTTIESIEKMRGSDDALDLMFREARTYNAWLPFTLTSIAAVEVRPSVQYATLILLASASGLRC